MSDIVPTTAAPLAHPEHAEITSLLQAAVSANLDVDKLERLIALKERMEDRRAAQEFAEAKAAFQSECPPIVKNRETPKASNAGGKFNFRWADLSKIADTIRPVLTRHGLSYSFDTAQENDGKTMVVTCRLSHIGGHSETSTMRIPVGSTLPVSDQQKVGATSTYAMRYALVQALGLTTADEDHDGSPPSNDTITEAQANELNDLIIEAGANRLKFLQHFKVAKLGDLPADRFEKAAAMLQKKITEQQK